MKIILTTIVLLAFAGMAWGQETSSSKNSEIEELEGISATVGEEIANIAPLQKTEDQKLKDLYKKSSMTIKSIKNQLEKLY